MSLVPSPKWMTVNGKDYLNNRGYTVEEMATVADWKNATPEQKEAVWDRCGTGGLYTKVDYDQPPPVLIKCEIEVRLSSGETEQRVIAAHNMGEAMDVAHCMDDVKEVIGSRFFSRAVCDSEYDRLTGDLTAMGGLGT